MNAAQRIRAAVENREPDRVPIMDWIDEPTVYSLAHHLGLDVPETRSGDAVLSGEESLETLDLLCTVMVELGIDATWYPLGSGLVPIGDGLARDKCDRVYRLSEHGMPMILSGPIEEPSDVVGFDMAAKLTMDDMERLQYLLERMGQDCVLFLGIVDPFQESWYLRGGMDKLMIDFIREPGLVHDLARVVTDYYLAAIELGARLGVEFVMMGGDLAGEQTTLMSPRHYREFIKPYERELVDCAHRLGTKIAKHTDGNAWPILDDFVEIGFDGFNPVQPECMDIGEVKAHLAGKMSIIGNIDCRNLLPFGRPEEVERTVRETIEIAAPGGGYILASSNSLHPDCKPENIVAMVEAAHKYGVYREA
jgi:uroporphyrinogen decarboxylase